MQRSCGVAIKLFCCIAISPISSATELAYSNPGGRAKAMAGNYAAYANDSSAIWYNPAGVVRTGSADFDSTIEWSENAVAANTNNRIANDNGSNYINSKKRSILFAAISSHDLVFIPNNAGNIAGGIAYYTPNNTVFDLNEPVTPRSAQTFGAIQANYHELIVNLAGISQNLFSYGASFEYMWTEIECLEFSPCVDSGPWGVGITLGGLYDYNLNKNFAIKLGAVWRSRISLGYAKTPDSGVGYVLTRYLPDRPASATLSVALQVPASHGIYNINMEYNYAWWSEATNIYNPHPDYSNYGVGMEWLYPLPLGTVMAVRLGARHSAAKDDSLQPDFNIFAAGLGISLFKHHFIDIAYEVREVAQNSEKHGFSSITYSYQY